MELLNLNLKNNPCTNSLNEKFKNGYKQFSVHNSTKTTANNNQIVGSKHNIKIEINE